VAFGHGHPLVLEYSAIVESQQFSTIGESQQTQFLNFFENHWSRVYIHIPYPNKLHLLDEMSAMKNEFLSSMMDEK
jgi:hypothetical protein